MESKKWYSSKTLWANALAFLVAGGLYFGVQPDAQTVQKTGEFLTFVVPVINVVLRFITKKPIE